MATPLDTIKAAILGDPADPSKSPSRQGVVNGFVAMQIEIDKVYNVVYGTVDLSGNAVQSFQSVTIGAFQEYVTSAETDTTLLQIGIGADASNLANALTVRQSGRIELKNLPVYENDAAAVNGGLLVGNVYQTTTGWLRIVLPVASPFAGGPMSDIINISTAMWDPAIGAVWTGAELTSIPNQVGNDLFDLGYRWETGALSQATMNGLGAITYDPTKAAAIYSRNVAELVGAGTSVPFVVYGSFRIATLGGNQTLTMLDSDESFNDYTQLYVDANGVLSIKVAASVLGVKYASAIFSENIKEGRIYTYVLAVNPDQSYSFWLNGLKIDRLRPATTAAFPDLPSMNTLTFGAFNTGTTGAASPTSKINGDIAACGFLDHLPQSTALVKISEYMYGRYGI